MIPADLSPSLRTHERKNVQRKRYQEGSLQVRSHGTRKNWVVLYREGGARKYHTLGLFSKLTKSAAQERQKTFMTEVNARATNAPDPNTAFGDFLEGVALPFYRRKWKRSTAETTENRMLFHLVQFHETKLQALTLNTLQDFLTGKARAGLSRSVVAHLRWDLSAIFRLAVAEGYTQRDPTVALYTPKEAKTTPTRALTIEEVQPYLEALAEREQVIACIAIFTGMRPGEILALQRRHINQDCTEIVIEQALYRGTIDDPKTTSSNRTVAVPPETAALLKDWMELVGKSPNAWLFASENPAKPLWRDNAWYRCMKPRLVPLGLGWANFQALRRTHASIGHELGIDPKVSADQRGHGIGVAIDVYTKSPIKKRAGAAEQLEKAVLKKKIRSEVA